MGMPVFAFRKMHGTGNDFVILDGRAEPVALTAAQVRQMADRHRGIGCDQLLVLHPSTEADVRMQIFNADGGEISTCGNATRCIADWMMREMGKESATIETSAGLRRGIRTATGMVEVNMGAPKMAWSDIPLAESRNSLHLGLQEGLLMDPVAVNMGNPHAIFFVTDLGHIHLEVAGPKLEHHPIFPERANISAVQVLSPNHLKMQVWERGTGITLACGSAACAALVAGVQRGLTERAVRIDLPGGTLHVRLDADGTVCMAGPVVDVFEGRICLS